MPESNYNYKHLYEFEFPTHLQNPNARVLFTAAYLLRYNGYLGCAEEVEKIATHLMEHAIATPLS